MIRNTGYLIVGIFFGFVLSRSGASDYNYIHWMFAGENMKLALLMGTAIVVGAIGIRILKIMGNKDVTGKDVNLNIKQLNKYTVPGGILFGIGWGISGACPGTVLAQIGEGKILGVFTFIGIVCGTYLYALLAEKNKEL